MENFRDRIIEIKATLGYDRRHEMMNNHQTFHQILGNGIRAEDYEYKLQSLKGSITIFTTKILDKLNQEVCALS